MFSSSLPGAVNTDLACAALPNEKTALRPVSLMPEANGQTFTFDVPSHFIDHHIHNILITVPVKIAGEDQIYDARALVAWLACRGTSPATGVRLAAPVLVFQKDLYQEICQYLTTIVEANHVALSDLYPRSLARLTWRMGEKKAEDGYFTELASICQSWRIQLQGFERFISFMIPQPVVLPPLPVQPVTAPASTGLVIHALKSVAQVEESVISIPEEKNKQNDPQQLVACHSRRLESPKVIKPKIFNKIFPLLKDGEEAKTPALDEVATSRCSIQ